MAIPARSDPFTLTGVWDFERTIVDHAAGEEGRVRGTTELARVDADQVRWSERGAMWWRGQEIPVSRVLYVHRRGAEWFVTFDDGRDFHPWTPGAPVEHHCGADLYRGRIDMPAEEPEQWTVEWRVTGPEKDYLMSTVLTRLVN